MVGQRKAKVDKRQKLDSDNDEADHEDDDGVNDDDDEQLFGSCTARDDPPIDFENAFDCFN